MRRAMLMVACLVAGLGHDAAWADSTARFAERPNTIRGVVGIEAPTGAIAIEYERALARILTFSGAAGVTSAGASGATMVRLRHAGRTNAVGIGVGGGYGARIHEELDLFGPREHDDMHGVFSADAAVFLEHRWQHGAAFRVEAGASRIVRMDSCMHVQEPGETFFGDWDPGHESPCATGARTQPFVAFSLGKAF